MLDLFWKHYSQLWPLQSTCSQNWARLCMPDPASHLRSSSVLPKKAWIIVCKSGLVRFWPNASGPEASWCARIIGQLWQNANRLLPVSYWDMFFHRQPRPYCVKPVLADCKEAGVQESSGLLPANASDLIQIRCKLDKACLLGYCSILNEN